jgi:alkyl sulfatase BDS1-like metallo-beta-lactamase superfamily hydrolase
LHDPDLFPAFVSARRGPHGGNRRANATFGQALPFEDRQDFADATGAWWRPDPPMPSATPRKGRLDTASTGFWKGRPPGNGPSKPPAPGDLNNASGLFKVTERVYQVRGYDLANMGIVVGDTGYIIIDPSPPSIRPGPPWSSSIPTWEKPVLASSSPTAMWIIGAA